MVLTFYTNRRTALNSKMTSDKEGSRPKLSLEMPKKTRRSVRDLLKLGYATLSPIAEDQVKRPNEKRKSGDATFYFGERKKKTKTGV